ncbi:MAG: MFS transporter [Candidatus Pelagadaptatus aseana]|uniref:MFS transporter n=1 Tax=Candidatus Pelagadaptatus aseana TaxID=3120508 RepID=UPI0039B1DAA1
MNRSTYLLSLCQALLTTGNILLVAITALIGKQLAPSSGLITLPLALQFAGLMCATIPASMIMGWTGRQKGFFLGNGIGILGAGVAIVALLNSDFSLFCVATFLIGVGIGFGNLYRFAVIETCDERYAARAISIVMAGGVLAAVLGPNMAIQAQKLDWGAPFVPAFAGLLALYVLALILLVFVQFKETSAEEKQLAQRPLLAIVLQPAYITAVLAGMTSYAIMNLIMSATPLAMTHNGHHFNDAAIVIQWHVLGMFAPGFFTGQLINRWGVNNMMLAGGILILACIGINLTGESLWHYRIALILLGVGWAFMFISATTSITSTYSPSEKPKAQAANEFLVFSSVVISSICSGWLVTDYGWAFINQVSIPFVVTAMLAIALLCRKPATAGQSNV